jgi:hypothetical protein
MSEIIAIFPVFLIGILASFFGTIVGGGTLLSIPFLIMIGLPPQVAIATERFGGLGQTLTSFTQFYKSKKIVWKYVFGLTIISVAGSIIGSNILINIDPLVLRNIIGLTILLLLPLFFLKRDLGIKQTVVSKRKIIIGSIIYFFVQIFAAFYGGGTGILIAYTLMFCFGLTILESTATKIIPWFFLSISSLMIFANKGITNYKMGVVMMAGMTIGAYLGARVALRKGNLWVKRMFIFFVIISVIKLLF